MLVNYYPCTQFIFNILGQTAGNQKLCLINARGALKQCYLLAFYVCGEQRCLNKKINNFYYNGFVKRLKKAVSVSVKQMVSLYLRNVDKTAI